MSTSICEKCSDKKTKKHPLDRKLVPVIKTLKVAKLVNGKPVLTGESYTIADRMMCPDCGDMWELGRTVILRGN